MSSTARWISRKHRVTIPQLCIQYMLLAGHGAVPLLEIVAPEHMSTNTQFDFEIWGRTRTH